MGSLSLSFGLLAWTPVEANLPAGVSTFTHNSTSLYARVLNAFVQAPRHARLCRFGTVFASFRATTLGTLCGKRTTARGISKTNPKDHLAVMSVTD